MYIFKTYHQVFSPPRIKFARFPCCALFKTTSPSESIAGTLSIPFAQDTIHQVAKFFAPKISQKLDQSTIHHFARRGIDKVAIIGIDIHGREFALSINLFRALITLFTSHSIAVITPLNIPFAIQETHESICINHSSICSRHHHVKKAKTIVINHATISYNHLNTHVVKTLKAEKVFVNTHDISVHHATNCQTKSVHRVVKNSVNQFQN